MSFLNKVWRVGVLGIVAVGLMTAACADDDGAFIGAPEPTLGSISGTVRVAGTNTPIVGALVGTTPATSTALTDAQGNFSIQNIPIPASGSASFAVTASHSDFITGAQGTATVTLTEAAPNVTGVNLLLTQPTTPITSDTFGNLQVLVTNRDGVAQPGATVVAKRAGATDSLVGTTDANGFVIFNQIRQGAYTVRATRVIGGITFRASGGVQVRPRETAFLQLLLARDFGQTVFPNIRGEAATAVDIDLIPVPGARDNNPDVDCNIIRTQHMFIARTIAADGRRVSGVKVQWDLNISENGTISVRCPESADDPAGCTLPTVPGNTGSIVDSDDPDLDPFRARTGLDPAFTLDTRKAVTFTNDQSGPGNTVSFNNTSVTVGEGETWIIITSPVEGVTDVIVSTPDIGNVAADCGLDAAAATRCDKDFAIKRWVNWNAQVFELVWPNAAVNGAGIDTLPVSNAAVDPFKDPEAIFTPITRGSTLTNVLSRGIGATCPPVLLGLAPAQQNVCILTGDDHLFISVVSRLRADSPFNLARGRMVWDITDDTPDVDFFGEDAGNGLPAPSDGCSVGVCNVENNGPSDDQFWINSIGAPPTTRNTATGEFDANNNVFDGGLFGPHGDEDDFRGWVVVEVRLDPAIFFCVDGNFDGDCNPFTDAADSFSPAYQALLDGVGDITSGFRVRFIDEFGEVCAEFNFNKRFVTSRIRVIKNFPGAVRELVNGKSVKTHTVQVGETFSYTITAINDGEVRALNVRITDTLPRFGIQFEGPPDDGVGVRDGNQAFRYVTDRPSFDPQAVVYGIDSLDDGPGDVVDFCIIGRQPGNANAAAYTAPAICPPVPPSVEAGTIAQARTAATGASNNGHQVVFIQYYDEEVLARTPAGGTVESEDSVEITLRAHPPLYTAGLPAGTSRVPGVWCNIATVTDGPFNRGTRAASGADSIAPIAQSFDADTLCHRVVEALLDIRKTTLDAVITAGDSARFRVEVSNAGSAPLNVVIADTVDQALLPPGRNLLIGDIRVNTTNFPGATAAITGPNTFTVTLTIPPNTPFREAYQLVIPTTTIPGTFCNRVTARGSRPGGELVETDIACIVVLPGAVEFDVSNEDGFRDAAGVFQSAKEVFRVGDGGTGRENELVYQVIITNRSTQFTATNVVVVDAVAPNTGNVACRAIFAGFPTRGTTVPAAPACNATGFTWNIGTLGPGQAAEIQFRAEALSPGDDVNRVTLTADQLSAPRIDEEPTTVVP